MYLRKVTVRSSDGSPREYLRLQESYRERQPSGGSKPRQRVIRNIGRVDLLAPHADRLYELLTGQRPAAADQQEPTADSVQAWDWGPLLVLRALWNDHLQLDRILRRLGDDPGDPGGREFAERAFALVANRLLAPSSELGLAEWLETSFVCDDRGRRWLPQWRDDAERRGSRTPEAHLDFAWRQGWDRTLEGLVDAKDGLEVTLFKQLRTLFATQAEVAMVDITSERYEGDGPLVMADRGRSRDQPAQRYQDVLGLVLIDGWPITHHIFEDTHRDATTVSEVAQDLRERFGLQRIVFVGEQGVVDDAVRAAAEEAGCGYLVELPRQHGPVTDELLAEALRTPLLDWEAVTSARTQMPNEATSVLAVRQGQADHRWFAVHRQEGSEYERMEREHGGVPLFETLRPSARAVREECYFLETTEMGLSAVEAVDRYERLAQVESYFARLRDVFEVGPLWQGTDKRMRGQVRAATLALLLQRVMERRLEETGVNLSANEALAALRTVKLVEFDAEQGGGNRVVTNGSELARRVLAALQIQRQPPPLARDQAGKNTEDMAKVATRE